MANEHPAESGALPQHVRIPERGEKASWIREALAAQPQASDIDLATQLQSRADEEAVELIFKPVDIATVRRRQQEQPASAVPAPLSAADAETMLRRLVAALGKDEVKRRVDALKD
jgi:hypothetical protein